MRGHLSGLPAGSLLVVRAQAAAAGATSDELDAELTRLLSRTVAEAR